jgi:ATP phosphoribosyltransferase
VSLVSKAGYAAQRHDRELVAVDSDNDIEFFFLRPKDIPIYVADGVLDAGLTGRDLTEDCGRPYAELLALGFGKSKFCLAGPKGLAEKLKPGTSWRVATAYPGLAARLCERHQVSAKIVRLECAVETSVQLGVADFIADIVQSGRTLREAGLEVIGEPLVKSEAILVGHADRPVSPELARFRDRLKGIVIAARYVMVDYDVPRAKLDVAVKITPGLESPTISDLKNPDWVAVRSMLLRSDLNRVLDELQALGAEAIVVSEMIAARL